MFIHFPMHSVPSRFRHIISPLLVPALFAIAFFAGQTAAHFLHRPSGHTVSAPVIACGSLPPVFDSGSIPVSADGNWGLGFPSPGQTPVGNASADTLKNFDAFYVGDTSKPVIYLTFDAGYENGCTPAILEALKKHHVPATFFVVGNYLETSPELVKQMIAEGHTVANHTYHHPDMSRISDKAAFEKELTALETLYQSVTGQTMKKYYRPPQGKYNIENLKMAQEPADGKGARLQDLFLESRLCGLDAGSAAIQRRSIFQASDAHPPRRDRPSAQHFANQRSDSR